MPGKPPYFPLYVADIESDGNCEAMTPEQFGSYMRLLCKAWHEEPTGTIPNDDEVLSRWCRMPIKRWKTIKAGVLKPFTLNGDGRLHQKRMAFEFDKLSKKIRAGAKPKQKPSKSRAKAEHLLSNSDSNSDSASYGEGSGERAPPKPPPGQPPESQLATLWLFFLKGPRSKATELPAVTEIMAELLRKGTPFEQIESRITDKARDWSEPIWDFAKHWKPKSSGKLRPTDNGFYDGAKAFANAGKDGSDA